MTRKIVSEIVSSGTLNPTVPIPYHRFVTSLDYSSSVY